MVDYNPVFMGKHKLTVAPACDPNLVNWNGFSRSPFKYLSKLVFGIITFLFLILARSLVVLSFRRIKEDISSIYPEYTPQTINPSFTSQRVTE